MYHLILYTYAVYVAATFVILAWGTEDYFNKMFKFDELRKDAHPRAIRS